MAGAWETEGGWSDILNCEHTSLDDYRSNRNLAPPALQHRYLWWGIRNVSHSSVKQLNLNHLTPLAKVPIMPCSLPTTRYQGAT